MKIEHNKPGYILALTLALMALFMFIATYVSNKGLIFSSFSKTMVDREKARQLAYGGIQLAISQLSVKEAVRKAQDESKEQKESADAKSSGGQGNAKDGVKKAEQPSDGKQLLKVLLPNKGRLQKFNLKQNIDGITGTLGIMIASEEGKININRMYDFEKHKFVGEPVPGSKQEAKDETNMKKMLQELFGQIREQMGADLFGEFEKFLKERKYPVNDVTELLTIKGFDAFKNSIFYDPTIAGQKGSQLYLTDIFTVSSSKQSIEPWLISNSLASLLKLQGDPEKAPATDELLKVFKEKSDWKNDWNKSLKNLYGVEFAGLPKFVTPLLNPVFDPKMFSVFSYATIGSVTVRLIALLEREKSGKDGQVEVKIRGIYLI
jgi:hypothetical protein